MMRGFSTLELMLALMITSTTITAIVLVSLGVPQALADGHAAEIGASEASALIQKELILGTSSFSSVASIASSTSDGYTTSLTVTALPDGFTKQLASTAEWTDERGQIEYLEMNGTVTDFNDAQEDACSTVLAGDWIHPSIFTFTIAPGSALPFGSALINHPISAVAAASSTLALAVTSTISKTDSNLFLFDISSSTSPQYRGGLDTATSTRAGFAALAFGPSVIYGANAYNSNFTTCTTSSLCSQLQIVDVRNPANPSVIDYFQLPTTTAPFAIGSGSQSAGKSIFYANGLVYLGLQKTGSAQGEEFNIIDVHDPHAPVWLGGYAVGRTVNQIEVVNGYAYLATDDPGRELIILDVHDPKNITFIESYDAPGSTTWGFGEAVSVASTTVALGRSYTYNEPEFSLLDTSATTSTVLSSENINTLTTTVDVDSILIRNFLAFVLTNNALQVWNIGNAKSPTIYGAAISLPVNSTISGTSALACRNNTLYIASSDSSRVGYLTVLTGS